MEQETSSSTPQPEWIPRTKFYPPQVGDDILARPDLLDPLYQAATQRRLTLLSAPAGSGKTVTAASLASAFPDLPLAWLALDEDDNDPVTFGHVLVLALRALYPDCGRNAMDLLASLPNPGAELRRVVGVLINEVLAADLAPFALVFDDYHLITETAIHEAMNHLLERLPPGWHLVIATRMDPPLSLARLRARGQLAEFRLPELRFRETDVQALFHEQLSLPLSPAETQILQARTEGWVAGLRLLATTLQRITGPGERRAFVDQFAAVDRHIFDLLAEEVLQRQPPELRTFLLQTSILRELTPRLCVAVTGRTDAPRLLDTAFRSNLFLSSVGERDTVVGPAYRYHDLFASFLRHQLQSEGVEQVAELHRRAAAAETTPARIVSHYLAAAAWEKASVAVEKYGPQLLQDGLILRLQSWIAAIPAPMRETRPWLNYLLGMCHSDSGDFITAEPYLQSALELFGQEGDEKGETAALVALSYAALGRHDIQRGARLLEQALARPLSPYERVRALINRAWLHLYQDDWAQIDADAAAAMHIALSSEDQGAINVLAHQLRSPFLLGSQGIPPFERYCRQVLHGVGDGVSVVHAGTYALLCKIRFLYGDLESAVSIARRARQVSQQLGGFTWRVVEFLVCPGPSSIGDLTHPARLPSGDIGHQRARAADAPHVRFRPQSPHGQSDGAQKPGKGA